MSTSYILAVDQGTSSTKTVIFDAGGKAVARASEPLKSYYTGERAEQDPEEIYQNVLTSVGRCLAEFRAQGGDEGLIRAAGISNQRETFVVWDAAGRPLYNAVVWQCKRSVAICERLKAEGLEPLIKAKTGLIADPYFSGSKLIWLHENVPAVREALAAGTCYFGTIDTWLLYKLTNGTHYLTDYTNASRTLFFNLTELAWDAELLAAFGLTGLHLPTPRPSSSFFAESDFGGLLARPLAITSLIGDSHAAAFGEGCYAPGTAKATLGTGSSVLMNIGAEVRESARGMISTICWSTEDRVDYALEGVIVSCGATIEWLKNELGLLTHLGQTEEMATAVPHNHGVYLVPAFSGLGAPHWDMSRKGSIVGLTFGSTKNHLVRAALESIPYQLKDVIAAMELDAGIPLRELMVDGGITSNQFIMQLLADLLERRVVSNTMADVSALGAAYLAGLKAGVYPSIAYLQGLAHAQHATLPAPDTTQVQADYRGWQRAIRSGREQPALVETGA